MDVTRRHMKKNIICSAILFCLAATVALAQQLPANRSGKNEREDQLDPSPVNPAVDPDINKFVGDWRSSKPRTMYGKLVFHDILTRLDSKDPIHPIKRGAVLSWDHSHQLCDAGTRRHRKGTAARRRSTDLLCFRRNWQDHRQWPGTRSERRLGFVLTSEFSFEMTNTGKAPLGILCPRRTHPARRESRQPTLQS